ncbi:hypothetical protein FACS189491_04180 [Spirochaetia bacterium]|nr:hypothetical protein FACS189491_04180 [Spirochaetia bacterium]
MAKIFDKYLYRLVFVFSLPAFFIFFFCWEYNVVGLVYKVLSLINLVIDIIIIYFIITQFKVMKVKERIISIILMSLLFTIIKCTIDYSFYGIDDALFLPNINYVFIKLNMPLTFVPLFILNILLKTPDGLYEIGHGFLGFWFILFYNLIITIFLNVSLHKDILKRNIAILFGFLQLNSYLLSFYYIDVLQHIID